jgi:N-acetylglucosamine kinase-like BadF-type ATPase
MRLVLGLDSGGTKTVAVLADEAGHLLGEARGAGANLQTHGQGEVERALHDVIERATLRRPIAALCLGMAGVDRPEDEALVRGVLGRLGHREPLRVVNDAFIALVAGSPARVGIVVLAGTGSIVFGVDPGGRTARAGGYGFFLADEGSARWLGHEALRSAVRATDRRGPQTLLLPLLFEALGVSSVAELLPVVYGRSPRPDELARLAGLVQQAFEQGDAEAGHLLDRAAEELALAARAVAGQLAFGGGAVPVVLGGGAFKACPELVPRLSARLRIPGADAALLSGEPALGAVTLARDLLAR